MYLKYGVFIRVHKIRYHLQSFL